MFQDDTLQVSYSMNMDTMQECLAPDFFEHSFNIFCMFNGH